MKETGGFFPAGEGDEVASPAMAGVAIHPRQIHARRRRRYEVDMNIGGPIVHGVGSFAGLGATGEACDTILKSPKPPIGTALMIVLPPETLIRATGVHYE